MNAAPFVRRFTSVRVCVEVLWAAGYRRHETPEPNPTLHPRLWENPNAPVRWPRFVRAAVGPGGSVTVRPAEAPEADRRAA